MNPRAEITRHVRGRLERESRINLHRHPIDISTRDGKVVLEGVVGDVAAKKLAVELAATVDGVKGVDDHLLVVPGEVRGDGAIRNSLAAFFLAEQEFRNCTIRERNLEEVRMLRQADADGGIGEIEISVTDGVIRLEGRVISQPHRLFAGVLGWWTPGRRDVINALLVSPAYQCPDDEVSETLRIVLEADPMIDADQIQPLCEKGVVTLRGTVPTEEQKRRAELDAWSLWDVRQVINKLEVPS